MWFVASLNPKPSTYSLPQPQALQAVRFILKRVTFCICIDSHHTPSAYAWSANASSRPFESKTMWFAWMPRRGDAASKGGTGKTVKARFWPWPSGKGPQNL